MPFRAIYEIIQYVQSIYFSFQLLIYGSGHCKFVNFSGQRSARLNADQSIYTSRHSRGYSPSLFIRVFDLILFGSASSHAEELDGAWVDKIIHFPRWKAYITKLNAEWSGFTFYVCQFLFHCISEKY